MSKNHTKFWLRIELWLTIMLFLGITIGFLFFREEAFLLLETVVDRFGLYGLFGLTVIMDAIIQPISPDILTVGYAMADEAPLVVGFVAGIASVIAGLIGYSIGRFLGEEGIDKFIGRKNYKKTHKLFTKHGFWAVLIGAISPIPFSAICWSAGIFKMPWKFFALSILITRLPRFLVAGYLGTLL